MTFDEWFDHEYGDTELANDHELGGDFYFAMRNAWEAGYADGVEAIGGPIDV